MGQSGKARETSFQNMSGANATTCEELTVTSRITVNNGVTSLSQRPRLCLTNQNTTSKTCEDQTVRIALVHVFYK